jgi:hypothetical protein
MSSILFRAVGAQVFFDWLISILIFFKEIVMPLYVWIFFFLLDSKGYVKDCFKSVWKGYRMTLFNLPIVMILASFLKAGHYTVALISNFFPALLPTFLYDVTYPFVISLIATVYIKRLHDQCSLFFGRGCA